MLFRLLSRSVRFTGVCFIALVSGLAGAAVLSAADAPQKVKQQEPSPPVTQSRPESEAVEKPPAEPATAAEEKTQEQPMAAESPRRLYRGTVVNLREALQARDIRAEDEFDDQYVLQTTDGRLIPIVPDWRGRAFYQDRRLRNRPVQVVGSQPEGLPWLQVLMVFLVDEDGHRQYMDYWCDICSIPMYQIKPCDCCQAPVRLRFQERALPDYLPAVDREAPAEPQPGKELPPEEPLPEAEGKAEH